MGLRFAGRPSAERCTWPAGTSDEQVTEVPAAKPPEPKVRTTVNCYECTQPNTAVAVCHFCGAGLCRDHVHVRGEEVHELAGTAPTHAGRGRRMLCRICVGVPHVASEV
ncbi:DUF2180 family protein [Streptomyces sp. TRM49041]|uniref:DUF2180 family protein n=1 Tax=Streptomyces sp. TRM49041 TaxID=2603216 RepID=UPI0021CCD1FE|nr:DUF2180 family protein [Streptomyces sp. TRM49041]